MREQRERDEVTLRIASAIAWVIGLSVVGWGLAFAAQTATGSAKLGGVVFFVVIVGAVVAVARLRGRRGRRV